MFGCCRLKELVGLPDSMVSMGMANMTLTASLEGLIIWYWIVMKSEARMLYTERIRIRLSLQMIVFV